MALDWSPIMISSYLAGKDLNEAGQLAGNVGSSALGGLIERQEVTAGGNNIAEYLIGFSKSYAKDNNLDYADLVEENELLQLAEQGTKMMVAEEGKL